MIIVSTATPFSLPRHQTPVYRRCHYQSSPSWCWRVRPVCPAETGGTRKGNIQRLLMTKGWFRQVPPQEWPLSTPTSAAVTVQHREAAEAKLPSQNVLFYPSKWWDLARVQYHLHPKAAGACPAHPQWLWVQDKQQWMRELATFFWPEIKQ